MSKLSGQAIEVINRNAVVSLALRLGFNAYLPVYDAGVDFVLYRESDNAERKVQLKSRWTIAKKYLGRDIWVAFPIGDEWYLVPHDEMVRAVDGSPLLQSDSWAVTGIYHREKPPAPVMAICARYKFGSIAQVTDQDGSNA